MKRFATLFFTLFIVTAYAQKASFKEFYKANKDKSEFSLGIPGFIGRAFIDKEDFNEHEHLIKKAKHFRVMVFNNEDNSVTTNFKKFVRKNKLKTLVRVKDDNDNAEIYFIEKDDYIREIILSASSKGDELVLLGLKTKLTKDELASIVSEAKTKVASK